MIRATSRLLVPLAMTAAMAITANPAIGTRQAAAAAPTTITWLLPTQQMVPVADSAPVQLIEKKFNVKFQFTEAVNGPVYTQKVQLALASHSLPDLMSMVPLITADQYGPQGAFLQLNSYLASSLPNLAKILGAHPAEKYNAYNALGSLWMIPGINLDLFNTDTWSYNASAFAGVGVTNPTTWSDVTKALTAIKVKYPQSYPLTTRGKDGNNSMLRTLTELNFTHGLAGSNCCVDDRVGWNPAGHSFLFEPTAPGFQGAISLLASYYKQGLLDPNYPTESFNDIPPLFSAKHTFMTADWGGGLTTVPAMLKGTNNKQTPLHVPTVAGGANYQGAVQPAIQTTGTVLSSSLRGAKLQLVLQIFNYLFSDEFFTAEYHNPAIWNAKTGYIPAITVANSKPADTYLPWSIAQLSRCDWFWQVPTYSPYISYWTHIDLAKYLPVAPVLPFTPAQSKQIATLGVQIDDVWNAKIDQFISGALSMSSFNSVVAQARAAGGDQLAALYNSIYHQYFKS